VGAQEYFLPQGKGYPSSATANNDTQLQSYNLYYLNYWYSLKNDNLLEKNRYLISIKIKCTILLH